MGGGFGVRVEDLERAGGQFGAVSSDLSAAVSALRTTLAGLGDYCGADEEGRRFAAGYDPQVAEAGRALDTLVRALDALPGALGASAAAYRDTDAAASDGLGGPP